MEKILPPLILASLAFLATADAATMSYSVTSSDLSGTGSAAGKILADAQEIGSWTLSGWSLTGTAVPSMNAFTAAQNLDYKYNLPGVGITMSKAAPVTNYGFGYSVSATIDPAFSGSYTISGVTIFGRNPTAAPYIGPIGATNSFPAQGKGNLTFSGFSGKATISDPNDNLAATNGMEFTNVTDIGGYKVSPNGDLNAWTPAQLQWSVSTDAGGSMTYAVVYNSGDSTQDVKNESTAFAFNVIPEPSTYALAALGAAIAGLAARRRKQ